MSPDPITVLHVDDQSEFRELAQAFPERVAPELRVLTAGSAEDALGLLATRDVDCVVSDYDMPGQNGIEFLRTLRERGCSLPFILFTGKGSEEVACKAISAGVTDYLQKAGNVKQYEVLANRIRNATERDRTERHVQQVYEAIDLVSEGVGLLDADGRFVYANEAYADALGYTREDLRGRHWSELYRDEADVQYMRENVLRELARDETWRGTTLLVRADGTRVRVDHGLAYTTRGMMVCLVSNPTAVERAEAPAPVVGAAGSGRADQNS